VEDVMGVSQYDITVIYKAYYIFIAYEVFQVAMIIVLEVLRTKGIMANKGVNCKFFKILFNPPFL
jgi:hypothetical protein